MTASIEVRRDAEGVLCLRYRLGLRESLGGGLCPGDRMPSLATARRCFAAAVRDVRARGRLAEKNGSPC